MKRRLFIQAAAILAAVSLLLTFALPAGAAIPAGAANEVVRLVNEERAKEGLSALKSDYSNLHKAAKKRATELPLRFNSKHERPDGRPWHTVLEEYNVRYTVAGENIAYGYKTAAHVMQDWMASPGHRENIMDKRFTHIGVGIYEKDGVLYWSQEFVRKPPISFRDIFFGVLQILSLPFRLLTWCLRLFL